MCDDIVVRIPLIDRIAGRRSGRSFQGGLVDRDNVSQRSFSLRHAACLWSRLALVCRAAVDDARSPQLARRQQAGARRQNRRR
jgi:hypothetical protein